MLYRPNPNGEICDTWFYEHYVSARLYPCNQSMQWFLYLPGISMSHIEGAKEHYKEINKSALEASPLSDEIRKEISSQIDLNAEKQINKWISILQVKGIIIIK